MRHEHTGRYVPHYFLNFVVCVDLIIQWHIVKQLEEVE